MFDKNIYKNINLLCYCLLHYIPFPISYTLLDVLGVLVIRQDTIQTRLDLLIKNRNVDLLNSFSVRRGPRDFEFQQQTYRHRSSRKLFFPAAELIQFH